ncbi:MAG: hypothetical protein QW728_03835 [Thermoplasmata archaeon]
MVEFKNIAVKKINFGKNNFIEVARKTAHTEDGENEFISISRGYYAQDGAERFKKSISVPIDKAVREELAKYILEI